MTRQRAAFQGALALAIAALVAAPAMARDAEQIFEEATDAFGEGDFERAAGLLEEAARSGNDGIAAESLFLVGEIYEDQLDRPADAAVAYREIVARHPTSRVAVAASRRLEVLEGMLSDGDGGERLGRFLAAKREESESNAAESLARGEALLGEDPSWMAAARVRLWMAGVAARDDQRARAEALYVAAFSSEDADVVFEARTAAAALARERGAYERAREYAEAIDPGGVAGRLEAKRDSLAEIARAERRAGYGRYAVTVLIALPIAFIVSLAIRKKSLAAIARAMWPPPIETIYLGGVLSVMVVAAFTGHHGIAGAVVIVSAAGLALSWLGGAAARAQPPALASSLAFGLATALGVLAAFYVALLRGGLIDLILATVRFGPDV